jgi:hypothetical protein
MAIAIQCRFLIACIALCASTPSTINRIKSIPISSQSNGVNVSSNISTSSEIERLSGEIKASRDKAELWDKWNIRFLFIAGFAALCLFITAIGVSRSNKAVADLSEQLDKAKDRKLQADLKSKDDEIAVLNKESEAAKRDAERLKLDIAATNERAANAEKAAADAHLALERLKSPRRLTDEQEERMAAKMRVFEKTQFDTAIDPSSETQDLLLQIENTLQKAGWSQIDWGGEAWGLSFTRDGRRKAGVVAAITGVLIEMHKEHSDQLSPAVTALTLALRGEGIATEAKFVGGLKNNNPNAIHIIVGDKPKE